MSSKGYATPLRLDLGHIPLLRHLYLAFVVAVGAVIASLQLPLPLRLFALALFLFYARLEWRRRSELGGPPLALVWDWAGRWWWRRAGELEQEVRLLGESYCSARVVVLNFRPVAGGRRLARVLTPASTGKDLLRRLRVRLRIDAGADADSSNSPSKRALPNK